jgi:hypothetical protein
MGISDRVPLILKEKKASGQAWMIIRTGRYIQTQGPSERIVKV